LVNTKNNLGVTVNTATGNFAAGAIEISGVVDTNPVDLDGSQLADTSNPFTLALSAPAQVDEILIAAFSFDNAVPGPAGITINQWSGATPTAIFINDGPSPITGEFGAGAYLITNDLTARTVSFSASIAANDTAIKAISLKGGAATLDQKAYRYFNDDGSESGSTAMAAQNVDVTVSPGGVFRIRFGIQATGDPTGKQFRLEYDNVGGSNWKQVP
jgi:hypothetical protein